MSASSSIPRWQRTKYSPFTRQWDVSSVAARFIMALAWDKLTGNISSQQKKRHARWLVRQLLELGPTFIKIGQALSTRADLIPIEYIDELTQLQDQVPAFSVDIAIEVIETELGSSIKTLFRDFDRFPLASASLGQVHRAKLHTEEEIVIKVQRPGLEKLFNLDFEVIHQLVRLLNRYFPKIRQYQLEELYNEFFGLLYQEIDYLREGKNAERFQENFLGYPQVIVPKVYWRYTTKKVLALEYKPGIKIDDRQTIEACELNPDRIIQLGISYYLKQLLEDGFFQSDPHPGNMAVSNDGSIIFYDFGTMAEVKALAKDKMIDTFFAVMRNDTDELVNNLLYMGLIEPLPDMAPVKRLVNFILEQFRDKPVDLKAFEQMSNEVYLMFEQQPFRLPPEMMFAIKSVSTLDGIARALNPQYNLLAASTPFFKDLTRSASKGNLIKQVAKQTKDFIEYRFKQPTPLEKTLMRLEERIERGEFQLRVRSEVGERALKRLNLAIKGLIYTCLSGFSLIAATLLVIQGIFNWSIVAFCFSGFWFIFVLRSLIRLTLRERLDRFLEK